jgi:hypothetical protein
MAERGSSSPHLSTLRKTLCRSHFLAARLAVSRSCRAHRPRSTAPAQKNSRVCVCERAACDTSRRDPLFFFLTSARGRGRRPRGHRALIRCDSAEAERSRSACRTGTAPGTAGSPRSGSGSPSITSRSARRWVRQVCPHTKSLHTGHTCLTSAARQVCPHTSRG